jgi:glucose-6-phosphate 1-dehydrogenase
VPEPTLPTACDFVVIGGTGDLTMRKLLPALLQREVDGQLPPDFHVLALSMAGLDSHSYRDKVAGEVADITAPDGVLDRFLDRISYLSLDLLDDDGWPDVAAFLDDPERVRVFYMACSPALFGPVSERLARHQLVTEDSRVVLEKPIGTDLASSREINDAVGEVFEERQIFRIDHYLGKESVQNLLVTRFANTFLEPLWNSTWIDHVQITVAETLGVGERAGYYEAAGAVRDMVQNHLLQLLCLVAMEPPTYIGRETVRDEKLKVLQALRRWEGDALTTRVVPGQYGPGLVGGCAVPGYADEVENPTTMTETFIAMRVHVDNWRWAGVPFYLRTGKRMDRPCSEIVITFKPVPHSMFPGSKGEGDPNRLVIRLQPDEGMRLHITAKEPGPGGIRLRPASLDLSYADSFGGRLPEAYERLLMDVVRGNPTLFMRRDEVEAAWAWIEPLLDVWERRDLPVRTYPAGTPGPMAATSLIERDGRAWHESDN